MGNFVEPLFNFLASDPKGLIFTVPEVANDKCHPLNNLLEITLKDIEPEYVQTMMEDNHFRFINGGMNSADFEREARIECLRQRVDEEILVQRCKALAQQRNMERPYPYNHEALSDVLFDDDYLVPLNCFSKDYGPLCRRGYAFGVVPPVPSVNSAYWFVELLRRPGICEKASVRLDPFLNRRENDFPYLEYRAWCTVCQWIGTE